MILQLLRDLNQTDENGSPIKGPLAKKRASQTLPKMLQLCCLGLNATM